MKKYFIFAAAAVVAASCAKAPVPVQTPDGPEVPAVEGREAVQFGSNLIANVETKANGSVDAWGGQDLYIYGLKKIKVGEKVKPLFKGDTYKFIDNVKATAPASGTSDAIEVKKEDNGEYFYYEGTSTYYFFGYYVDDAYKTNDDDVQGPAPEARQISATTTPADSAIVLPIKINGGQDILLAKASADYAFNQLSAEDKKAYWTNDDQTWTETNSTWNSQYAFSAYSARRKVHPYLNFEHQLAQINFFVKSGTTFTNAEGKVSPQLYVQSVEFKDVNTTAELYIASSSTDPQYKEGIHIPNDGPKTTIAVTKAEGGEQASVKRVELTPVPVPNKGDANQAIGAATMLFPAESYSIEIKLSQEGTTYVQPITVTLDPANIKIYNGESSKWETPTPAKTSFEAGYKYNVIVTVYGLEKIDITVELEKWGYGGEANLDTDEAPEF